MAQFGFIILFIQKNKKEQVSLFCPHAAVNAACQCAADSRAMHYIANLKDKTLVYSGMPLYTAAEPGGPSSALSVSH